MILNQFDPAQNAVFDPHHVVKPLPGMPKTIVTCFAHNLIEYAASRYPSEIIGTTPPATAQPRFTACASTIAISRSQ